MITLGTQDRIYLFIKRIFTENWYIFIVALKSSTAYTRLNIFPELSGSTPLNVEKAHLMAAGLTEDLADSLLVIMCEGAESLLLSELYSSLPTRIDGSTIEPEKDDPGLN
jgi:hypothetical protein